MRSILLVALLASVLAACSDPAGSRARDVVLQNGTDHTLLYLAAPRDGFVLVDPNPRLPVAAFSSRLVGPGQARVMEMQEYARGDDVRLFLYRVQAGAAEGHLARILVVTHEQLLDAGFRIVVDAL